MHIDDEEWNPTLDTELDDFLLNDANLSLDDAFPLSTESRSPDLYKIEPSLRDTQEIAQEEKTPPAQTKAETPVAAEPEEAAPKGILINFNNVSVIEFIRYISRLTNKNFIFDDAT